MTLPVKVFLAIAALASAVLLAGCGGDVVSLDPVAQAATRSSDNQSFRFSFSAAGGAQGGAQSGALKGDGAYDADAKRLKMSFGVALGQSTPMSMDLLTDTSKSAVVYVRFPFLTSFLPQGKSWVKVDLAQAAKAKGLDLGQLLQANRGNPAEMLSALVHSKDAQKLGTETVGGAETTHYRTTIDPKQQLLDGSQGEARKQLEQALGQTDLKQVPVDVWVGDDGLVRRLKIELPPLAGAGVGFDGGTFTEELSGYGEPVEVALPAADEVVDASDGKLLHP